MTAGEPHLKDYLRDPIGLYDENKDLLRKVPKNSLPKPQFDVVAGSDFVAFDFEGQKVYLRNSDVLVEGRKAVCSAPLNVVQAHPTHNAVGDIGVKSNMATANISCVPPS